jgi:hypothetical protein
MLKGHVMPVTSLKFFNSSRYSASLMLEPLWVNALLKTPPHTDRNMSMPACSGVPWSSTAENSEWLNA